MFEQLGCESYFVCLCLLDVDCFYDYEVFVKEEEQYVLVVDVVIVLFSGEKLSDEVKNKIIEFLFEQDVELLFKVLESYVSEDEIVLVC